MRPIEMGSITFHCSGHSAQWKWPSLEGRGKSKEWREGEYNSNGCRGTEKGRRESGQKRGRSWKGREDPGGYTWKWKSEHSDNNDNTICDMGKTDNQINNVLKYKITFEYVPIAFWAHHPILQSFSFSFPHFLLARSPRAVGRPVHYRTLVSSSIGDWLFMDWAAVPLLLPLITMLPILLLCKVLYLP